MLAAALEGAAAVAAAEVGLSSARFQRVDPAGLSTATKSPADQNGWARRLERGRRGVACSVEDDRVSFVDKKDAVTFTAPYSSITKLVYERTKKPRYSAGLLLAWPLLFTKEKQHYVTVEAAGKFAFVKLRKQHYRSVIAALESSSGMAVERLEE